MAETPPRERLERLIAELVAIETENPPGNEGPCARFVADWFEERGIDASLVFEPDEDRPQAVATVGDGDPTVVLNGHLDVVPADEPGEWAHDPYDPTVEDGRMYGRGTVDMKAGIAIAMLTAERLRDELESGSLDGSVVVHAAMGEETGDPGTKSLLDAGYDGDYGVVLEPTGMRTATSAKGLGWYEVTVGGEASHASRPDQGSNAVRNAEPVLDAIAEYDAELRERVDDLVGPAYATVTAFEAGVGSNRGILPGAAHITLDRRVLPDESIEAVDREVADLLAAVEREHGVEVTWERDTTYESAAVPVDSPLAETFRAHSAEIAGVAPDPYGIRAATDVRNFVNDAGMEAVTWGPGSLARAHTRDEFVELDAVETGLEVLEAATRDLLNG
ncbi:M20 family metallopeptidase [Halostella litorea]|uniref:M20 family metallopeptidase n=1 Tax=Halostella litorea TaxID=2528831 RepID=UPI001091A3A9|nr:M20 family metallopeptidase [Halostella litorea]